MTTTVCHVWSRPAEKKFWAGHASIFSTVRYVGMDPDQYDGIWKAGSSLAKSSTPSATRKVGSPPLRPISMPTARTSNAGLRPKVRRRNRNRGVGPAPKLIGDRGAIRDARFVVSCELWLAKRLFRAPHPTKGLMATEELHELRHRYKTAYTAYLSCVRALSDASQNGVWPSAEVL